MTTNEKNNNEKAKYITKQIEGIANWQCNKNLLSIFSMQKCNIKTDSKFDTRCSRNEFCQAKNWVAKKK
jgi:hypothetical protein